MKIDLKLYATLTKFLPEGSDNHTVKLDVAAGTTATQVIEDRKLPKESCFLVLVNGVFLTPELRDTQPIKDGDTLAIWPPIAGG